MTGMRFDQESGELLAKPMTAGQRARKIAAARKHMAEALVLLDAVCADYSERSYRLTREQREQWRETVEMASALDRANRA